MRKRRKRTKVEDLTPFLTWFSATPFLSPEGRQRVSVTYRVSGCSPDVLRLPELLNCLTANGIRVPGIADGPAVKLGSRCALLSGIEVDYATFDGGSAERGPETYAATQPELRISFTWNADQSPMQPGVLHITPSGRRRFKMMPLYRIRPIRASLFNR